MLDRQRASNHVRGHPLSTYAKFSGFLTPSSPCTHFGQVCKTKFTQTPLLRTLLGPLPLGAYVLYGCSLMVDESDQLTWQLIVTEVKF